MQLHDAVRRELDEDPEVSAHDIAVVASDGVITLTGFVDKYAAKLAAERSARRVRGVRAVANDIQTNARSERTDPDIARDAVRALDSHTDLSHRVTVTVRHGFLTLDGVVEQKHQRDAAESAVKYIHGVRSVSNLIQISQTPTSIEVKTWIEGALRHGAEGRAGRVRIEADGNTVTLLGHVYSWAESQEAERAAWSSPGVIRVENQLVVEPEARRATV